MCGIAGVWRSSGQAAEGDRRVVGGMLQAQRHRGPDAERISAGGGATLGHRRLAILDLSEAATQPMTNETGGVVVTFNGEIYNYRELRSELKGAGHAFACEADSEVLVHGYEEWGLEGLLVRVCGMYAFALHDTCTGTLFLARDRLGIKPLYYAFDAGGRVLYFASEVRALAAHAPIKSDADEDAIFGFLALGSVPWPHTILQNVRCLAPGHYLSATAGAVGVRRYWTFGQNRAPQQALPDRLREAFRQHLLSDVPLGIFLSGGVDSAGLVALACELGTGRLDTLTIGFDEAQYDESAAASAVARAFRTNHREIGVSGSEFLREVPNVLAAMDQPAHDGANTYFVARAAARAGLTVVLSGLGGDEVFWGYPHYRRLAEAGSGLGRLLRAPGPLRNLLARGGAAYGRLAGREALGRLAYLRHGVSPGTVYLAVRGLFPPAQIQRLLGIGSAEMQGKTDWLLHLLDQGAAGDARRAATPESFCRVEVERYLHDQLLRDTDVFSMAHSIEARVPYLDHRVVEAAASFGARGKLSRRMNKPLLVRAIGHPLVRELAAAPKRGFTFPFQRWMRENARELGEAAERGRLLEKRAVRVLWRQQERGRLHWSRAWATLALAGASGKLL